MHSIWTFKTPFTAAICNCNLSSGCMAMKLTATYDIKVMWRGETVAALDAEACTRCGACAKVCPFSAITRGPRERHPPRREVLGLRHLPLVVCAERDLAH